MAMAMAMGMAMAMDSSGIVWNRITSHLLTTLLFIHSSCRNRLLVCACYPSLFSAPFLHCCFLLLLLRLPLMLLLLLLLLSNVNSRLSALTMTLSFCCSCRLFYKNISLGLVQFIICMRSASTLMFNKDFLSLFKFAGFSIWF